MPHLDRPFRHHAKFGESISLTVNSVWTLITKLAGKPSSWFVTWTDEHWPALMCALVVLTIGVVAWDIALYYDQLQEMDWLWITAYPVGLYVLIRSSGLPDRIYYLRRSLVNQGILDIYDHTVSPEPSLTRERIFDEKIEEEILLLESLKGRLLPHTAVLTVLFCLGANYVIHHIGLYRTIPISEAWDQQTWNAFGNHALGHLFIFLATLRLGRIVAFGVIMWAHGFVRLQLPGEEGTKRRYRIRLDPQPGHPDGNCGLRHVLDFWTYEASLLVPPLIYTMVWLAISHLKYCGSTFSFICEGLQLGERYSEQPGTVYLRLTLILIAMQLLSLWSPLLALRMHMGNARNMVKGRLDEIVRTAGKLRFAVSNSDNAEDRNNSASQLSHVLEAYQDYQNMPLWPVSRATLIKHLAQLWTVLVFLGIEQWNVLSSLKTYIFPG